MHQRGRRNVATKEQLDYISGKRYEAQKNINRLRDEKGVFIADAPSADFPQLDQYKHLRSPTASRQAIEEGIHPESVRQNAKFAKGIDAIKEVAPELADKILKHKPEDWKLWQMFICQ